MASKNWIKIASLVILSFQNVLHALAMRQSRSASREKFFTSSVVILSEIVKCVISATVLYSDGRLKRSLSSIYYDPIDFLRTCVPAVIYVIQNSVLFFALSHLDTTVFQVCILSVNYYLVRLLISLNSSPLHCSPCCSSANWSALFSGFLLSSYLPVWPLFSSKNMVANLWIQLRNQWLIRPVF